MTTPPRRETIADWKRLCRISVDQTNRCIAELKIKDEANALLRQRVQQLEAELKLQREILARYHQDNCKPRESV